jgi:hypothetical protein
MPIFYAYNIFFMHAQFDNCIQNDGWKADFLVVNAGWTLSSSFEYFGATRAPKHFGGSAISRDGRTVVVAVWDDELTRENDSVVYRSKFGPPLKGKSQKVSLQWIAHLKWAVSHCNGRIRVVVLTPEDGQTNPRVIRSCFPDQTLSMRIMSFDRKTGFFTACTGSDQVRPDVSH